MKVQVTAEDITEGCPINTLKCPVARAVSRAAGLPASVHWNKILVFDKPDEKGEYDSGFREERVFKEWDTPPEVTEQIKLFDDHQLISPFEFEL